MPSKKHRIIIPLLMISLSLMGTILLFLQQPATAKVKPETQTLSVSVAEVIKQDLRIPVTAQGTVSPHRETTIVAEVGGRVIEVSPSFYAGGYVKENDMLLRIDDVEHQAKLSRAKAGVASAQSGLAQEKGRAEVAQQEYEKFPNKQRTTTAVELYLRKPQLKQVQAQLLSALADLRKAEHDLDRTVIRAPYDALIKDKRSDLGSYLAPGTGVATLFAIDFAEIRLAVPQSKLPYLELPSLKLSDINSKTGSHVNPTASEVDLYTNLLANNLNNSQHWTAQLHRSEGIYDERTRVLFVVARVQDPYLLLQKPSLPEHVNLAHSTPNRIENSSENVTSPPPTMPLRVGTFVNAVIKGRVIKNLVVLPRNILRAGDYLWVVDAQNTLRNRKVTTLRTQGNDVYITAGLEAGELVCLQPLSDTVAGSSVKITSKRPTASDALTTRKQHPDSQESSHPLPHIDSNGDINAGTAITGAAI